MYIFLVQLKNLNKPHKFAVGDLRFLVEVACTARRQRRLWNYWSTLRCPDRQTALFSECQTSTI